MNTNLSDAQKLDLIRTIAGPADDLTRQLRQRLDAAQEELAILRWVALGVPRNLVATPSARLDLCHKFLARFGNGQD